ncbi:MAG: hypothetical protein ACM31E_08380 [Fibrobacterota bacterium]|nr:hypothetical protein [Chitinispirillaceae bacterium]
MYEKPQYLTPDGYRRAKKNPFKSGLPLKEAAERLAKKNTLQKNEQSQPQSLSPQPVKPHVANFLRKKDGKDGIKRPAMSEEAAQLIAAAISNLLKSK